MIGTSVNTLLNAPVGTAWKAPTMGGYIAVVRKYSEPTAVGSVTAQTGDVLVAMQMKTAPGSSTNPEVKPYVFLLQKASQKFVGGDQQDSKTVPALLTEDVDSLSGSTNLNGPSLTPELLSFLLGSDTWTQSTVEACEAARSGQDADW